MNAVFEADVEQSIKAFAKKVKNNLPIAHHMTQNISNRLLPIQC